MSRVLRRVGDLELWRVKDAVVEDPVVSWQPREDEREPCLEIRLRSGRTLLAEFPKPLFRRCRVVSVVNGDREPSLPTVAFQPDDEKSWLTDRSDIVQIVLSWAEDYLLRQGQR